MSVLPEGVKRAHFCNCEQNMEILYIEKIF